jgi:L-asparaginase II
MRLQIDVLVWRGAIPESRHRVQAAVSDPTGRLEAGTEQPEFLTTFRSAAKPFQLLPLVERGHAEHWRWSDPQLAVMSASHTGSRAHVELVSGILERLGLGERHLACGFHEPADPDSLAHVRAHPEDRSPLYNNCSGKHAGMLCLALSEGWPVEGYERQDHPLQQLMRRTVAELCGVSPGSLTVAVDGCGVSVFGLPLAAMARAYARLAAAAPGGDARERALSRIRGAMCAFPRMVAGEGRFSTVLMESTRGRLVAKGGAEGLECVGVPARGLGLALKCEDGQARGVGPASLALLEQLGELSVDELERLAASRRPMITNHTGLEVGALEAVIKVLAPTP